MKTLRALVLASAALASLSAPAFAQQVLSNPTIIGHEKYAPDGASPVLSACGTSPAIQVGSSDAAGRVVTGSGATTCTITFSRTFTQAPVCNVTAEVATAPTWTVSSTAITFATSIASTAYHYTCNAIGSGS